jgi:hypothetical protein
VKVVSWVLVSIPSIVVLLPSELTAVKVGKG